MQIAICDDEKSIGLILEEKIKKLLPDAVIEKYLSGDELIASGCKPDILFLDIQMPGMDGMETARLLRQKNERMVLIFVTAVEEYVFQAFDVAAFHYLVKAFSDEKFEEVEYVFQAFDVAAFHYLVKPFSDEKFEKVVKRAVRSIEQYSENQSDEKYMMVQSGGSHMKVFLKDIVYAEVYNRKVIIHTRDTNIEYYGKLQELSEIAGADFFRTHRAYLVHFKYVQKYDANCVTMENGTALIAKQNYPEFVKQYLKYNQRKGKEIG
ncbi:putative DNA-binding response regulator [Clostridium sp. CAG:62]|nr:putative DNA-binding response regulator [Clostridium sp. CAG:62]